MVAVAPTGTLPKLTLPGLAAMFDETAWAPVPESETLADIQLLVLNVRYAEYAVAEVGQNVTLALALPPGGKLRGSTSPLI
jgi:hypothetical protein